METVGVLKSSVYETAVFTNCRENMFFIADLTEVYTWGNNINFTLGHGGQQSKHHPELVDLFPRNSVYIKQVFCKYYIDTFLSECGRICGGKQQSIL